MSDPTRKEFNVIVKRLEELEKVDKKLNLTGISIPAYYKKSTGRIKMISDIKRHELSGIREKLIMGAFRDKFGEEFSAVSHVEDTIIIHMGGSPNVHIENPRECKQSILIEPVVQLYRYKNQDFLLINTYLDVNNMDHVDLWKHSPIYKITYNYL